MKILYQRLRALTESIFSKKRRGGNGLFYSITSMHVLSIEKYFDCLGWEVRKAGNHTLYIKARKEEE